MPLIETESTISPYWLPNGHFQSIYPALFRKVNGVIYHRERIVTPDEDFLDLDWSYGENAKSGKLAILSHGLEGNSTRQYILGMVKLLNRNGFDCLAWNFRGCGGEMNKTARFYHSGASEDLDLVIQNALTRHYEQIHLLGFSLGGNLTLKYLGESGADLDSRIKSALVFSVPMDLRACSLSIIQPENKVYMHRFLNTLKPKVNAKAAFFPDRINVSDQKHVRTLYDFDHIFTAPLHGFDGADHYYEACSSKFFIRDIAIPTMVINAKNDPIVPYSSLPLAELKAHAQVCLVATPDGGHCGFRPRRLKNGVYWSEERALEFLSR
ncbi:YheT family hydrolase [Dyadobacter fanqingshengii]|uniref:Alpha/beta fold hydrolase n=1 Tax=Dyadobacter fanqingshengii TaxID=2906443 RepID=A0A9X1P5M3_9BACT|nr:alpha/beta fold hydrolase [Dyadobacter fanqingshengii]MCF0039181.1 alpha/beta fold hydrolase [Dyadobacter fanqingshengii]USJ34000.1 alpha/beta fold hydrolase [Dyadobacter fanqingshengii]